MEEIILRASRREVIGKQVKALRRTGKLPAVLYGKNLDSIAVVFDFKETSRILEGVSASTLLVVQVDGNSHYALVRERQRDVISGSLLHVDFQAVSLTEKVRAEVSIVVTGESPAVKELGSILVTAMEQLEVEAFPRDLPEAIEVDISNLKEIGDAIHVRDLTLPEGVTVSADPDELIVVMTAPEVEIEPEEKELEEEALRAGEPEVIERGKREEEEEE